MHIKTGGMEVLEEKNRSYHLNDTEVAKRTGVAAWLALQASSSSLVPGEDDARVTSV